jgi:hypothetical protein
MNELVLTSNKLTSNFAGLVTSGRGPDVGLGPPVFFYEVADTETCLIAQNAMTFLLCLKITHSDVFK